VSPTIDGASIAEHGSEREPGLFDGLLRVAPWLITVLAFLIGWAALPWLPERMASHWDATGAVNGYMPRVLGAFLLPAIMLVIVALLEAIPIIDPLKKNIARFRVEYDGLVVATTLFMLVIYVWTIAWSLGLQVDSNVIMPLGTGLLFIYIGFVMRRTKRNYMVGIRTPWTLASDEVWDRTHDLGGWLFVGAGVVTMFGALVPTYAVAFILVPMMVVTTWTVAYSYVLYHRLEREGRLPAEPPQP
jgi:uncharacterized membrane protein